MTAAEKNKEESEGQAGQDEPVAKKSSAIKIIIIILIIMIILGGAGAGAYIFLLKPKQPASEQKATEPAKPKAAVFWAMDPFIVNLIDNEGERYAKVVLQLELSEQGMLDELNIIKPKVRDSIIDLLSAKNYKEMMDPIGKQRLRDEIAMRVNALLSKGKVLKVYFTDFVIQ